MEIRVPYGRSFLTASLPEHIGVDIIEPPEVPAAADPPVATRAALENLLGNLNWADFAGARSVAVAINDKTRPVPELFPSGCENHLDATLTLMLGRWLLDRAGFQHNPEFDTSENRYFGAHCTCALNLHGPQGGSQPFAVRPFFHQLPKSAALDVQWTPGEPVLVAKYLSGKDTLSCWTGKAIESPASPPTGGCATRVLAEIDGVQDVCDILPARTPCCSAAPVATLAA